MYDNTAYIAFAVNGVKIFRQKKDNYFLATPFFAFKRGTRWDGFKKTKEAKTLIEILKSEKKIPFYYCEKARTTMVHPRLAVRLAYYTSSTLAAYLDAVLVQQLDDDSFGTGKRERGEGIFELEDPKECKRLRMQMEDMERSQLEMKVKVQALEVKLKAVENENNQLLEQMDDM